MTDDAPNPGLDALSDALNTSFRVFRGLLWLLLASYLASGIFIVRQHEKAFVLHFGKIAGMGEERIKGPGLHWTWPRPFSEVVRVPVERIQTLTTSTFWVKPSGDLQEDDGSSSPRLNPERVGYLLTGDANIIHGRWSIRYTIFDPLAYAFHFSALDQILHDELDRTITRVLSRFAIDRALRTDLNALRETVETELTARGRQLGLGLRIQGVDLLAITPPQQVAPAFDAVVQAEQERSRKISEAHAYATRAMNEAHGQAARTRMEGETYKRTLLADLAADADAFKDMQIQYEKNPAVLLQTLTQETLRRVMARVEQKFVVQGKGGGQEIRLQLGPAGRRPPEGSN